MSTASTPPRTRLLDLPTELLVRVLSHCDPFDIARVAAVSLLFHASLAGSVEGIRIRLLRALSIYSAHTQSSL